MRYICGLRARKRVVDTLFYCTCGLCGHFGGRCILIEALGQFTTNGFLYVEGPISVV